MDKLIVVFVSAIIILIVALFFLGNDMSECRIECKENGLEYYGSDITTGECKCKEHDPSIITFYDG